MNIFNKYLCLELKRSVRVLKKTIINSILVIAILVASMIAISYTFMQSQTLKPIRIGIVASGEDKVTQMAIELAAAMDSVKSICSFQQLDQETAEAEMEAGNLQAVVILPVNFSDDLYAGINTSPTIMIPEESSVSIDIFQELLKDAVVLLRTSQASIFSTYDMTDREIHEMDTDEIIDILYEKYTSEILFRNKLFQKQITSPFGDLDEFQFYYVAACMLIMLMLGLNMGHLYCKESRVVEQKLRVYGLTSWKRTLLKMLIMTIELYLFAMILYVAGIVITGTTSLKLISWSATAPIAMLLLCMAISAHFHLVYTLAGNGIQATSVLLITNVIMIVMSGLVIPTAYLPKSAEVISKVMPVHYWTEYTLDIWYGPMTAGPVLGMLAVAMLSLGIGGAAEWKKS